MKAVRFDLPGEPASVLNMTDMPRPEPKSGEVLVRMLAAPVNPSDLMYIRGQYTFPPLCPATPGFEGVGVVEQSGGGLKGFLFKGRRVAVLNKSGGNWANYVTVPASQVIPVSSKLTVDQCASFFVNPATALVMTQHVLKIPRGAWLVQSAAGSVLGRMVIRLGREFGFRTLNIVRRSEAAEELRRIGADHVEVMPESEIPKDLPQRLSAVVGADGPKFIIDPVGGPLGSALVRSLGRSGRMLVFGTLSGQPLNFSPRTLMATGSRVEGFALGNFMESRGLPFRIRLVRRLTQLIQSGVLATPVSAEFPLEQIREAVRSAEGSSVTGKILLRMSE